MMSKEIVNACYTVVRRGASINTADYYCNAVTAMPLWTGMYAAAARVVTSAAGACTKQQMNDSVSYLEQKHYRRVDNKKLCVSVL